MEKFLLKLRIYSVPVFFLIFAFAVYYVVFVAIYGALKPTQPQVIEQPVVIHKEILETKVQNNEILTKIEENITIEKIESNISQMTTNKNEVVDSIKNEPIEQKKDDNIQLLLPNIPHVENDKLIKQNNRFIVISEILNIRKEPNIESEIMGKAKKEQLIDALEISGDWVRSEFGWLNTRGLKKVD